MTPREIAARLRARAEREEASAAPYYDHSPQKAAHLTIARILREEAAALEALPTVDVAAVAREVAERVRK